MHLPQVSRCFGARTCFLALVFSAASSTKAIDHPVGHSSVTSFPPTHAVPAPPQQSPADLPANGRSERDHTLTSKLGLQPGFILGISIGLGVVLRLLQFGANRSLWLDEVLQASGVLRYSLGELLHPSSWNAAAPGYLLATRVATLLGGPTEYALRSIPLVSGLLSLFLFTRVADRFTTPRARTLAVALFSLSPFLIYYSSEVKQYATDVLATIVLLLVAVHLEQHEFTGRRAAGLWVAGTATVFFSQTSAFVLAGLAVIMLVEFVRKRARPAGLRMLAVCVAWGFMFGVPYLLFVGRTAESGYLQSFWRSGFMPLPPRSVEDLAWFPDTFLKLFRDPLGTYHDVSIERGFYQAAAGMLCFVAGLAWMRANRRRELSMLMTPVLVVLFASAFRLYPFGGTWITGGRVLLFLVPLLVPVMAEGAAQLWSALRRTMPVVPALVIALLVAPSLTQALVAIPYGRAEIKPILSYVREHWQQGDRLYVHYDNRHEFSFYAQRFGFGGDDNIVLGPCARAEPAQYLRALNALRAEPRVWVLFGSGIGARRFNEKAFMLGFLERIGTRLDDQVARASSVYLYDLRTPPGKNKPVGVAIPTVPPTPEETCALWDGN